VAALDAAGGEAVLSERGEELEAEKDTTDEDNEEA
jgi:large subunit ribosomal protein L15